MKTARICAQEGEPDASAWQQLVRLLERLSVDGMSDEEPTSLSLFNGGRVRGYRVLFCHWRAPEIANYMNTIDNETTARQGRRLNKRGTTSLPRTRVHEKSTRDVPKRLPRAFYDREYLAAQSGWFVDEVLQVSEETFDLLVAAVDLDSDASL